MTPTLSASAAGGRPWWLVVLLAVLPLWNHPYFEELKSPNPLSRTYLTRALWDHSAVEIDQVERTFGDVMDRARRGPHTYCDKAPGSSFLLVPVYAALRVGTASPSEVSHQRLLKWGSLFLGVLPTFLALLCLDLLLVWLSIRRSTRLVTLCAFGLGGVGVPFELLFFGHQLAACLLVFTLWAGVRAVQSTRWRHALLAGWCAGWSVITEYPTLILVLCVAALCAALTLAQPVLRARRLGVLVMGVTLGSVIPLGLAMAYHHAAFGGAFTTGYKFIENGFFAAIHTRGFMGIQMPTLQGLGGTLFSANRGLFYFMPALLLAPVGCVLLWRAGQRAWGGTLLFSMVAYAMFAAGFGYWLGGWSLGPRHLVPAVPLFLLGLAAVLHAAESSRPWAWLAVVMRGLTGWSVLVIGLACVTHSGYPEEFVHPFFQMTLPLLVGGFFPHSLGTQAGMLRESAALLPLVSVALTVLVVALAGRSVFTHRRHLVLGCAALLCTAGLVLLARVPVNFPNEASHRLAWIMDTVWEPRQPPEQKRPDPVKQEPGFGARPTRQDERNHVGRHYARYGQPSRALEEYVRGAADGWAGRP